MSPFLWAYSAALALRMRTRSFGLHRVGCSGMGTRQSHLQPHMQLQLSQDRSSATRCRAEQETATLTTRPTPCSLGRAGTRRPASAPTSAYLRVHFAGVDIRHGVLLIEPDGLDLVEWLVEFQDASGTTQPARPVGMLM
eukprot:scaffold2803_cov347-Prasinococcus_capsulatus_cf.AAC.12